MKLVVAVAVALVSMTVAAHASTSPRATVTATEVGTDADDVLIGTPQADTLDGLGGNDRLRGGAGDDTLIGGPGSDDLAGGRGRDLVQYAGARAVDVTVDDLANDGATGEHDNVQTDTEDVFAGDGQDRLTGSAASNTLDGGAGDDVLDGGGGSDALYGGPGDDRLLARDGRRDTVDCGDGTDIAIVDETDRTAECEIIDRRPAVPRVDGTLSYEWQWAAGITTATRFALRNLQPGRVRIRFRCQGKGCPVHERDRQARGHLNMMRWLRNGRLRVGTRVEVRIMAKHRIGKLLSFRTRLNASPSFTTRCLTQRGRTFTRNCPYHDSAGPANRSPRFDGATSQRVVGTAGAR